MLAKNRALTPAKIEKIEAALIGHEAAEFDIESKFLPGLYVRTVVIPAGVMFTSMKHKTTHPFVMTRGVIYVVDERGERTILKAPYHGVTEAGTQRVVYVEAECEWTTYHATNKETVQEVAEAILEPHQNQDAKLLGRDNAWKKGREKISCHS